MKHQTGKALRTAGESDTFFPLFQRLSTFNKTHCLYLKGIKTREKKSKVMFLWRRIAIVLEIRWSEKSDQTNGFAIYWDALLFLAEG